MADHFLGEAHDLLVGPVGRVELHHRELGVVPDADPLVAEVAVDLEHALEPAHHQALQVELRRDAQVHLLVQRVVMRDEGLGVGAARDRVQHRRLDLQEAVLHHVGADRGHRLGARHEALARLAVGDQVGIALAVLLLLVGHAVELVRQRAQRLGQQPQRRDLDRQFAGAGAEERAFGAQDVAQVEVLEVVVDLLAQRVLREEQLDRAGGVLQRGEAGLAHDALEHHAAGHRHGDGLGLELLVGELAVLRLQRLGAVLGFEVVGEGRDALGLRLLADGGEFLAAFGDQLVVVLRGRRLVGAGVGGLGLAHRGPGKSWARF